MLSPLISHEQCTGCGACASRCPKHCIRMQPDAEGFLYPAVDQESCVQCGICVAECPVKKLPQGIQPTPCAFAAYSKREAIRKRSSSGGVFSEIAEVILNDGGAVVGATLCEDGIVRHRLIETAEQLPALCGSKYVQSEVWSVFPSVQSALNDGKTVLFTGTPCQIAAMSALCRTPQKEQLILVDVICHGTPSPAVWKRYWTDLSKGTQLMQAEFRNKQDGWKNYRVCLRFSDGTKYGAPATRDPYMRTFLKNISLRPSCYDCVFKGSNHVGDLTLADYWGVEHLHPMQNTEQGVSLVLVHSEKGRRLLNFAAQYLFLEETALTPAIGANLSYLHSAPRHPDRAKFFESLNQMPFDQLAKKYCADTMAERLKGTARKIKNHLLAKKS